MTDATHSGADLQSAANAISGLLDAGENRPSEENANSGTTVQEEPKAQENVQDSSDSESHEQTTPEDHVESSSTDAEIELPQSLDQLAQAMGVEADKLFGLKAKIKIDGQDGEATLADLIKSYQLEGHINKKSMALSEQQKAVEAELNQHKAALTQKFQQAEAIAQLASQELMREYNGINWQELRTIDPAEFAAKQLEFGNRSNAIQQAMHDIQLQKQTEQQQLHQQNMQQMQQFLHEQQKELLTKIPEWANEEVKKTEDKEICNYLVGQGFNSDEVKSVVDHRHVVLARKAMLYDKLMQSKPQVNNKVKELPKFIKASATKGKSDIQTERMQTKVKQLRKSGSLNDAASLLYDMI